MKKLKVDPKSMEIFYKACENIIIARKDNNVNWAVEYARHGLLIEDKEDAKIQALYILNNIVYWRGNTAKETRITLKRFVSSKL